MLAVTRRVPMKRITDDESDGQVKRTALNRILYDSTLTSGDEYATALKRCDQRQVRRAIRKVCKERKVA